ncbi:MAG TPA: PAS domain-containing protein, partial [Spirochaetota bacterium]|nr:PAS domain-containing protein [Spirochaetota bacterium]
METRPLDALSKDELIKLIQDLKPECVLRTDDTEGFEINYKSLVEDSPDVIYILDMKGNLVYQNRMCRDLFSRRADQPLGRHYLDYLPQVEHERAQAVFNAVLREGASVNNEKMKTLDKDGTPLYFISNIGPIRNSEGAVIGLLAVMRNITQMHYMEKMLRENSKRLEEKVQ